MAFFFLLLYITCVYMRPGEWIPAFYGWQLMDITAIAAAIFLLFELGRSNKGLVKAPQNILMLGFFGSLIASHLAHTYFGGMVSAFTDFGKIVILYFLIVNIVNSERKFKVTIWLIVILTLILAIQGIMQYNTGFGLAGQPLSNEGRIIWIGIFNDANDLALGFVIIVPILLGFILNPPFMRRIFALFLIGIVLYAIYLTNSRGGILALMAVIFLNFILIFKKKIHKIIGSMLGVGLASLVFIFGPSRMAMLTIEEESAFNRVDAWYEGFQMLKNNPIFGVGKGMFTEDYRLVAHNSFIHTAAESGLIGLFFWMALFYVCFRNLSAIQTEEGISSKERNLKSYANALTAGLFGFLAAAFFLSRAYVTLPYLLIALSTAIFNIAQNKISIQENKFTFVDIRNVGLLCIGTLALILSVVKYAL